MDMNDRTNSSPSNSLTIRLGLTLIAVCPTSAFADVAIPFVAPTWASMIVLFVPVVLIEALVYSRSLEFDYKTCIWPAALANFLSTIVGIPLFTAARGFVVLIGGGYLSMAVAGPHSLSTPASQIAMQLLSGIALPYIPSSTGEAAPAIQSFSVAAYFIEFWVAYILSVYIELRVLRRNTLFPGVETTRLKRASFLANAASYALLLVFLVLAYVWVINHHGTPIFSN